MEQLAPVSDADRAIGIMASRWALVARRPEDFGALGDDRLGLVDGDQIGDHVARGGEAGAGVRDLAGQAERAAGRTALVHAGRPA